MAKIIVYAARGADVLVTNAETEEEIGRVPRDRHGEFEITVGTDLLIHEITSADVAADYKRRFPNGPTEDDKEPVNGGKAQKPAKETK